MSRLIILTLLNLMLPFVLRFCYLAFKRWWVRRHNKKQDTNMPEPDWTYPWRLFLVIAMGLTLLMVMVDRLFLFEADEGFEHHIPKSEKVYK